MEFEFNLTTRPKHELVPHLVSFDLNYHGDYTIAWFPGWARVTTTYTYSAKSAEWLEAKLSW